MARHTKWGSSHTPFTGRVSPHSLRSKGVSTLPSQQKHNNTPFQARVWPHTLPSEDDAAILSHRGCRQTRLPVRMSPHTLPNEGVTTLSSKRGCCHTLFPARWSPLSLHTKDVATLPSQQHCCNTYCKWFCYETTINFARTHIFVINTLSSHLVVATILKQSWVRIRCRSLIASETRVCGKSEQCVHVRAMVRLFLLRC